jgi:hypothetical protein
MRSAISSPERCGFYSAGRHPSIVPACGLDATPLTIEPIPGPSSPGVVRMSFWMMCENATSLFETRKPWQLAFTFALPPPPGEAPATPAVARATTAHHVVRLSARFTGPPFAACESKRIALNRPVARAPAHREHNRDSRRRPLSLRRSSPGALPLLSRGGCGQVCVGPRRGCRGSAGGPARSGA